MTKHNSLHRVVLLCLVILQGVVSATALAGSIVINNPPGAKRLAYSDNDRSVELELTWSDIEVIAGVKRWLDNKYGAQRSDYPFMIDQQSKTVSILVDRSANRYEVVSFDQLPK
ncbi:hypothetical protein EBU99_01245 [bacterium]|nr:hypothetical protein [bacterium]